jgi:SAM-dependent methyltransferase
MTKYLAVKVAQSKSLIVPFLKRRSKLSFIRMMPKNARLLDVGCGNDSPFRIKLQRPDVYYVGLDIGDYNQTSDVQSWANEYLVVPAAQFAAKIASFPNTFDAVICAHNLEHCDEPQSVLRAMIASLKKGGRLYLSFPSEESIALPKRAPLNFYDDPTHKSPPNFKETTSAILTAGLRIDFAKKRYQPPVPFLLGLVLEPVSRLSKWNIPLGSTWALWGFETVIWASRPYSSLADS